MYNPFYDIPYEIRYFIAIIVLIFIIISFIRINNLKLKRKLQIEKDVKERTTCRVCGKSNYQVNVTYSSYKTPSTGLNKSEDYEVICRTCNKTISRYNNFSIDTDAYGNNYINETYTREDVGFGAIHNHIKIERLSCYEVFLRIIAWSFLVAAVLGTIIGLTSRCA